MRPSLDRRTVLPGTAAAAGAAVLAVRRDRRVGIAAAAPQADLPATASPPATRVRTPWSCGPGSPRPRRPRPARARARGRASAGRSPPTGGSATSSASGSVRHRPEPRPHRQARRHRAAPATLVLLPLPLRRRLLSPVGRTRTAPARATPSPTACASAWSRAPTCRPAGSAPTATSPTATTWTRCCTSATTSTSTAPASTATAPPTRTSAATTRPTRWSSLADYRQPARAVQDRPRPAGACTRSTPSIITWDDHEVTNDQWQDGAENHDASEGDYRACAGPRAPGVRRVDAGAHERHRRPPRRHPALPPAPVRPLAELSMLDLRTYRDQQVAAAAPLPVPDPTALSDPDRTIAGRAAARLAQGRPAHAAGRSGSSSATR